MRAGTNCRGSGRQPGGALFTLAATQVSTQCKVADCLMMVLCEIGKILQSSNQFVEAERCYHQIMSQPRLPPSTRLSCIQNLATINNRRGNGVKVLSSAKKHSPCYLKLIQLMIWSRST